MTDLQRDVEVLTQFSDLLQNPKLFEGKDDCFYICNLSKILEKQKLWMEVFPRVRSHYAVKCNSDELMLQLMIAMGLGFDCASKAEIQLLLNLGAKPDDIIFAHPYKQASHLSYAAEKNVKRSVFDTKEELDKTKKYFPTAELVLRIKAQDSDSQFPLSGKFGANVEDCPSLIDYARELGLNVVGISFHVGSNQINCIPYVRALSDARCLFDYAEQVGSHFTLLDIGGGFPGNDKNQKLTVKEIGVVVNDALEKLFPVKNFPDLHIISEPGRYYSTSAFNLVTTVIGKRIVSINPESSEDHGQSSIYNYHINVGCFGALRVVDWDNPDYLPINKLDEKVKYLSNIWGPTRTNFDAVKNRVLLPELEINDKILWTEMGCYSMCVQTFFSGVTVPPTKYVIFGHSLCEVFKLAFSLRPEV